MIRDLNHIENYNIVKQEDIKTFKINIFTKILETLKRLNFCNFQKKRREFFIQFIYKNYSN